MGKFTVYYEIGDHKMKTTVDAKDAKSAEAKIREKIIIHKIEEGDQESILRNHLNKVSKKFDEAFEAVSDVFHEAFNHHKN